MICTTTGVPYQNNARDSSFIHIHWKDERVREDQKFELLLRQFRNCDAIAVKNITFDPDAKLLLILADTLRLFNQGVQSPSLIFFLGHWK